MAVGEHRYAKSRAEKRSRQRMVSADDRPLVEMSVQGVQKPTLRTNAVERTIDLVGSSFFGRPTQPEEGLMTSQSQ